MRHSVYSFIIVLLCSVLTVSGQIPQTISYQGVLTDNNGDLVADGNYAMMFSLYDVSTMGSPLWTETQSVMISSGVFTVKLGAYNPVDLPFDQVYWLGIAIDGGSELVPRIELSSSAYSLKARSVEDGSITSSSLQNGQVVRSINSLKDDVILKGGGNVVVTQSGDSLVISASGAAGGDITDVAAGMGLEGGGSSGDVALWVLGGRGITVGDSVLLDVNYTDSRYVKQGESESVNSAMIINGAVGNEELAANAVTSAKIQDGQVGSSDLAVSAVVEANIANNAVTAAKISSDIVSSIDGVSNDAGNIDLIEGSNITITPNDANNTITIAATGLGSGDITSVTAGDGLTGGGTTGDVTMNVAAGTGISVTANEVALDQTYTNSLYVNEGQANSITSAMITDGSIGSDDITNNSVSNLDLADNSVSSAKIQVSQILATHIADNAVTANKVSPDIVSSIDGVSNDAGDIDFVAGSNITITPNDANNQITFSSSASSLWSQNGSDLYYISGNVGIGAVTVSYPLTMFPATNSRGISITHAHSNSVETSSINVHLTKSAADNTTAYGMFNRTVNDAGTGPAMAV